MKSLFLTASLLGALATSSVRISGCVTLPPPGETPPSGGRVVFEDGFEDGLDGWTVDADLPNDPNTPGQPVAADVEISTAQALEGTQSVLFTLDGRQDDGTLWIQRSFRNLQPFRRHIVTLSFALWSDSVSDANTLAQVAAYAGRERPRVEEDFDLTQTANQAAGWKQYAYEFDAVTDANGRLYVAIGINAVWETELAYYLDDVRIVIERD
jgi:hypothetical protein